MSDTVPTGNSTKTQGRSKIFEIADSDSDSDGSDGSDGSDDIEEVSRKGLDFSFRLGIKFNKFALSYFLDLDKCSKHSLFVIHRFLCMMPSSEEIHRNYLKV